MRIHKITKWLAKLCDSTSTRYALAGIHCWSKQGRSAMTATDSRFLASVSYADECGDQEPVVVEAKGLVKAFASTSPGKNATGNQELHVVDESVARVQHGGNSQQCWLLGGRYPRYQDVIPTAVAKDGYVAAAIDPKRLKTIAEMYANAVSEDATAIQLWVSSDRDLPVLFSYVSSEGDVLRTVLMQMSGIATTWPDERGVGEGDTPPVAEPPAAPAPPPECVDEDVLAVSLSTDGEDAEWEELPQVC